MSTDHPQDRWPTEIRALLERHPRENWAVQAPAEAQFWLEIHDHFRRACVGLESVVDEYREGRRSAEALAVVATPRLRGLVASLHGHHQIEDRHYFPAFRHAEPRLERAIAVLEHDHVELQTQIAAALRALEALGAAVAAQRVPPDTIALAADRYAASTNALCRRLCRHLSDEEDVVVPVMIELGAGCDSRAIWE